MDYSLETGVEICAGIAEGKSLVTVCREMNINYRHVFKWLSESQEFTDNYTRAREAQADYLADGVLDVADDATIPADERRVRIDARKWYAGKLKPKKYGERVDLNHGGQKENPLSLILSSIDGQSADLPSDPE